MFDEQYKHYCYFLNLSSSATLLNPHLEKYEMEFVQVPIASLPEQFPTLFPVTGNPGISAYFTPFDFSDGLLLLSSRKAGNGLSDFGDFQKFCGNLQEACRLFKRGDIAVLNVFGVVMESKASMVMSSPRPRLNDIFEFEEDEVEDFIEFFENVPGSNELTDLAEAAFMASYSIHNAKLRYLALVTGLESIFNLGRDQIAHTIARHASLILSSDIKEFEQKYNRIKELYSLRSQVIHGGSDVSHHLHTSKKANYDFSEVVAEVQEILRKIIVYCRGRNCSKIDLFKELNRDGIAPGHGLKEKIESKE